MQSENTAPVLPPLAPAPWIVARPVPADHGLDAELVVLGPRAERVLPGVSRVRTFYVVAGDLTVSVGATNHLLAADALLTVGADRAVTLRNHSADAVKLLALALPEPRVEWRLIAPDGAAAPARA